MSIFGIGNWLKPIVSVIGTVGLIALWAVASVTVWKLLTLVTSRAMAAAVVITASALGFSYIKMNEAAHYREISVDLSADIDGIKAAIALTETLRQDNAILTQERDDLLEGLRDASGAQDPLPDDVRRLVERMLP